MPGFSLNRAFISGRLVRDPEQREAGGANVTRLRLAVNDRARDPQGNWVDRPNYFTVDIWRGIGDWAAGNLHQGDEIGVEGRLRWREYEKDGQRHEQVSITADTILPPRGERRQQQTSYRDAPFDTSGLPDVSSPPPQAPSSSRPPEEADDDIPFVREPDRFEWEPWHRG